MKLLRGVLNAIKRIIGLCGSGTANTTAANEPKRRSKVRKYQSKKRKSRK